jgi:hypothetical protein
LLYISDILKTIIRENTNYDIETLLSIYDASFLGFEGEKWLDEARVFSRKRLEELRKTCKEQQLIKGAVEPAEEVPLHWRLPRLETRRLLDQSQSQSQENKISDIIKFAKLEYNQVQLVHQADLSRLSRQLYI